ncbi:hypothetical protein Q8G35_08930 [Peribacillus simplex]|uniref:Uncharacterized protein n=2 Tax=Peribacillus TaxID=2675229 RepID=A0AA90SW41_9BACI|nr:MULTISPECIES: hypothetical protein [Peribacillus]MDP1418537.1 hypothetical protein [Peribacillus simplex]MDP1451485.1 hypothetical protein [Peribacillus frigoritolerans]
MASHKSFFGPGIQEMGWMGVLLFSFASYFPAFDIQSKVCECVIIFKVDLKYLNIVDTFSIALPFDAGLNPKKGG